MGGGSRQLGLTNEAAMRLRAMTGSVRPDEAHSVEAQGGRGDARRVAARTDAATDGRTDERTNTLEMLVSAY